MGFLRAYGARRAGPAGVEATLFGDNRAAVEDAASEAAPDGGTVIELGYEGRDWEPIPVRDAAVPDDWAWRPRRFVDGKDVGRTVVWLTSPDGLPVPMRLAQVGAIAVGADPEPVPSGRRLTCEKRLVERVVAFAADLFPWPEVEAFVAAAQSCGFRVLFVRDRRIREGGAESPEAYDFGVLRDATKSRTINEMFQLERRAFRDGCELPTLVDGSLQSKVEKEQLRMPVTGVVKSHELIPLHAPGFRVLQSLAPGERTPAYGRMVKDLPFVTWFLRLGPGAGESPAQSVVRVEICRPFFEEQLQGDWGYVDRLSHWLCRARTRDLEYGRATTTVYPIQRGEDLLRAAFSDSERLVSRFYRLAEL